MVLVLYHDKVHETVLLSLEDVLTLVGKCRDVSLAALNGVPGLEIQRYRYSYSLSLSCVSGVASYRARTP